MQSCERSDILVLGAGIAGLTLALELADHRDVTVLAKGPLEDSATTRAQGGVAAVFAEDDSFDQHVEDTVVAGAGLCHEDVVRMTVEAGPAAIERLMERGVHFSGGPSALDLGREGGHTRRRVLHVDDMTGRAIIAALLERARAHPRIRLLENHFAIDLILTSKTERRFGSGEERCLGAYVMDVAKDTVRRFVADATVLATGGAGRIYLYTSNPDGATGDGVAMAFRAGAKVANMEFFQFHPTCLFHPKARTFLISEALRGEGGVLRLKDGEPFMKRYHELESLAPRDIVARSIDREMKRTGHDCVYLDMTGLDPAFLVDRFPNIFEKCLELGHDLRAEPLPVVPAAHYCCGGVRTDLWGRTSIPSLYACGEVASTGVHGANRLASNSLLEALVFGTRVAQHLLGDERPGPLPTQLDIPAWNLGYARVSDEAVVISQNWDEVRRLMWNYVGIVRSNMRLERANRRIQFLHDEVADDYWSYYPNPDLLELRNIVTVAKIVIDSAYSRRESRGLHFTLDYPSRDNERGIHDTVLWKGVR